MRDYSRQAPLAKRGHSHALGSEKGEKHPVAVEFVEAAWESWRGYEKGNKQGNISSGRKSILSLRVS